MGEKAIHNIVSNVVVNVVLFVLYVCLFGVQCIQKYLGDGVTIINHEVRPTAINPPGKCIEVNTNTYLLLSAKQTYIS